jgi:hypothetical protein
MSSVASSALQHFSTLFQQHDFQKKYWTKNCVLISYTIFFSISLSLRRIRRYIFVNYIVILVKHSLFLSDFNETLDRFSKNTHIPNIMNPSSGSRVVSRGRTVTSKLIFAFRNFANVPKNSIFCPRIVFVCFLYVLKKRRLLPFTPLSDWFCRNRDGEFSFSNCAFR